MRFASFSLAGCLLFPFLAACGNVEVVPAPGTTAPEAMWPKRATLTASFSDGDGSKPSVKLADGVTIDGEAGDLTLHQSKVLSLGAATPASICEKGTFDALDDIPADEGSCPGSPTGSWTQIVYLSATSLHTTEESMIEGLGILVRDADHGELYRLRLVSDSYGDGASTATFDYAPVP
ncbi:MAG: hypothetical protein U0359_41000 [Byssovorax sp.]